MTYVIHKHNWDSGKDDRYAVPDASVNEFLRFILTDRYWPYARTIDEMDLFMERCLRFRKKADNEKVPIPEGEEVPEVVEPSYSLPPMALERGGDPVQPVVKRGPGRPRKVA